MQIKNRESIFKLTLVYVSSFSLYCTGHEGVSPRIGLRFLLSAIRCSLLKRDDVSICSSFLSSCTSLLPSLSVNLLFRRGCMYALKTREKEKEGGSREADRERTRGKERKRGSRWVQTGRIYLTGCYLVTRRGLRLYDSPAWMMLSPMVSALSRHGRALTCR